MPCPYTEDCSANQIEPRLNCLSAEDYPKGFGYSDCYEFKKHDKKLIKYMAEKILE